MAIVLILELEWRVLSSCIHVSRCTPTASPVRMLNTDYEFVHTDMLLLDACETQGNAWPPRPEDYPGVVLGYPVCYTIDQQMVPCKCNRKDDSAKYLRIIWALAGVVGVLVAIGFSWGGYLLYKRCDDPLAYHHLTTRSNWVRSNANAHVQLTVRQRLGHRKQKE